MLAYPQLRPDGSCDLVVRAGGSQGDRGMNHFGLRPLTCFLTLALVTGVSSDALARAHQKHAKKQTPHAEKANAKADAQGAARHQRKVAAKQGKHVDRVA